MIKNFKFKWIASISLSLFLLSCSTKDITEGKLQKEIVVDEITRDGLTTIDKTIKMGPISNYNNDITKPRRELHSSCVIEDENSNDIIDVSSNDVDLPIIEKRISKPDFDISVKFKNTEINEALHAFGQMGGRNIMVDSSVQGVLNLDINNEPWNDVFHSLLLKSCWWCRFGSIRCPKGFVFYTTLNNLKVLTKFFLIINFSPYWPIYKLAFNHCQCNI